MSVQIGFYFGSDNWVHSAIKYVTNSDVSHCEVIIDGQGYTPKRGYNSLYQRDSSEYADNWLLIGVYWDRARALEFIKSNMGTTYDMHGLLNQQTPLIRGSVHSQTCSQFVVNTGSFCGDPRFHNRDATRYSPGDVLKTLVGNVFCFKNLNINLKGS